MALLRVIYLPRVQH